MGILNKLGFKKKTEEKAETPKPEAKTEPKEELKTESVKEKPAVKKPARDTGLAHQILARPLISEKGTMLASRGRYVFVVAPKANKTEVKKSIERVYGVNVESVNIVKVPGKQRRYGRSVGRTSNWKKAIVTVKAGEKIPGIIEQVG
jgi:large subunit ribosomal protein L23